MAGTSPSKERDARRAARFGHHVFKAVASLVGGLSCCLSTAASAWGPVGHRVVAKIAEEHLTPGALAAARRLLVLDGAHDLWDVSSWADREGRATGPLHSERLPLAGGAFSCPTHNCAVDGIERYEAELADRSLPAAEREIALKYIVHLVGDLHQPLHDVDAVGTMDVVLNGEQTKLHPIWDDVIIQSHGGSFARIADELMAASPPDPPLEDPMAWAQEGRVIARQHIYDAIPVHPTGVVALPADYAQEKWPIVADRLTVAGLRLGMLLNKLLGSTAAAER